ncbi:MAG: exostosin family protein [bacterium]|nr:exostosin family protein [bacterium]
MIKIWTDNQLNYSHIPLLYPNWGMQKKESNLFSPKKIFANLTKPFVEIVNDPSLSDFLLIPHNFPHVRDNKKYLDNFTCLSQKYNKKIIVFIYGDSFEKVNLPNSIIFRTSCYKSDKRENEIIMPAFVEDLTEEFVFKTREKTMTDGKPIIGFCGWTSAGNMKNRIKLFVKSCGLKKSGILLREKIVKILKRSSLIEANFIERQTYSGHASTISIPKETARREYLENMANSDFALTVRGDGNFSFRFYEALSAGRVPVFVNTDCPLPLEDKIKYNDFVLFVDYKEIKKMDATISQFYVKLDNKAFALMQQKARKAFENYLRADKFFEFMFLDGEVKKFL